MQLASLISAVEKNETDLGNALDQVDKLILNATEGLNLQISEKIGLVEVRNLTFVSEIDRIKKQILDYQERFKKQDSDASSCQDQLVDVKK